MAAIILNTHIPGTQRGMLRRGSRALQTQEAGRDAMTTQGVLSDKETEKHTVPPN